MEAVLHILNDMSEDSLVKAFKVLETQGNDLLAKAQHRHDDRCDDRRIKSQSGKSKLFELNHLYAQEKSSKNQIPEGNHENSNADGFRRDSVAKEIQCALP